MRRLPEVETARALMNEAMEWSVVKWLKETKRVRRAADKANEVLDALNQETKEAWAGELKAAYESLLSNATARLAQENGPEDETAKKMVMAVRRADDAAQRARQDAEDTFDEAERQLSARLAREGCQKAITSWELHEAAIRKAENAAAQGRAHETHAITN